MSSIGRTVLKLNIQLSGTKGLSMSSVNCWCYLKTFWTKRMQRILSIDFMDKGCKFRSHLDNKGGQKIFRWWQFKFCEQFIRLNWPTYISFFEFEMIEIIYLTCCKYTCFHLDCSLIWDLLPPTLPQWFTCTWHPSLFCSLPLVSPVNVSKCLQIL